MGSSRALAFLTLLVVSAVYGRAFQGEYTFADAQSALNRYCRSCHEGASAPGRLDLTRYTTEDSLSQQPQVWSRIYQRVREGSMPPKGLPAPDNNERERLA